MLERVWLRDQNLGDGTFYIISGFANYNGGVRFFPILRHHVQLGGKIVAIFGGSTRQNLTSRQVVEELLDCGAEVSIINRKRLMHAKSYGSSTSTGEMLVVTSGNFTGPGMAQNVEMAVLLNRATTLELGFSWHDIVKSMLAQKWDIYRPNLLEKSAPAWRLLYDEQASNIVLDETEEVTMILRLGHADTVRIMARPGSVANRGSQYFWLSRDCYDFFPALTTLNQRGSKRTYSCLVRVLFVDIATEKEVRVTFEAENNLDFRLGTGPLRNTLLADTGDLAALTRVAEDRYELKLFKLGSREFGNLEPYAINFTGHQGKKYGFISNQEYRSTLNQY